MWMNWFKVNDPTSTSLIALCFNSVSPQFHISPWEIRAHSLPLLLDRFRGAGPDNQAEQRLFNFQFKFYHTVPDPCHHRSQSPQKCTDLNVRVAIRAIFACERRVPSFEPSRLQYRGSPSSAVWQRHKPLLTAADCFDIYLIRDATSQSDSSPEQHCTLRARGRAQIKSLPTEN